MFKALFRKEYIGETQFDHAKAPSTGILLVNMGTPDAPTPEALRPYLAQFLWDPRVIELSRPLWWLILHGWVLRTRPKRSAKLYAKIWTKEGSPLLVNSSAQQHALEKVLQQQFGPQVSVELGMRYGNPSIPMALRRLKDRGARRILTLPLYPQYSGTTTASGVDAIGEELKDWRWVPELRTVNSYHDHSLYIEALARSVREFWATNGEPEKFVMSFHGIPKRYFLNGDPYHCQCLKTGRLLAEALSLPESRYLVCFQSLFGREEWLRPYLSETLAKLAKSGVKSIDVSCPGFTSDCVETLEEIEVENRDVFLNAGGKQFRYISALNARPDFIQALSTIAKENLSGWLKESATEFENRSAREAQLSNELYLKVANRK